MIFGSRKRNFLPQKIRKSRETMYPRAFGCYLNVGRSLTAHHCGVKCIIFNFDFLMQTHVIS